ncbi:MAG: phosphoribosylformylglycinamidine synthase subunit PurQ [Candidatus Peribacteraceae bacterium]|nr:phosphoribosylformylglycinamidine synthase subunit PurQ [Candidatus Peribacteraceae bacterium]MDD5742723.1 phosphoribosylformylglycinamidine synthase subunit PurQ [Candidatus Peribacteraceae bacterium]
MTKAPRIAVLSFPGNNCEVESLRAVKQAGMEAVFFKWNDSKEKLKDIDGYFVPGGFSYEDRGRSGMVAARDPLLAFLHDENERGKVIIGNCNGAQILVESGLIPLDQGLRMSLARNAIGEEAVGFINEWVWITPTCKRDRCATSDWEGTTGGERSRTMHLPIAHGEGRFTTKDKDVWEEFKKNDQVAFSYCNAEGKVSDDPVTTPNGSEFAIAGICNPCGNVVALMPHPERTPNGAPYFASMKRWIQRRKGISASPPNPLSVPTQHQPERGSAAWNIPVRPPRETEIFIGTIITNNEERTVEQAAHRSVPSLKLTQLKYVAPKNAKSEELLSRLSFFNPNKETAVVRQGGSFYRWNSDEKKLQKTDVSPLSGATALLRRDEPDTWGAALGQGSETGVCYICRGVSEQELLKREVLEVFANPHASTLERLTP